MAKLSYDWHLQNEKCFTKYFGKPTKVKGTSISQILGIQYGLFSVEIEIYLEMGSIGFVKIGYNPTPMITAFSTPNEQGISFEECCKQAKEFLDSQLDALQALKKESLETLFNQYVPIHCAAFDIMSDEICITMSGNKYTVISADGFSFGGESDEVLTALKTAIKNESILVNQQG